MYLTRHQKVISTDKRRSVRSQLLADLNKNQSSNMDPAVKVYADYAKSQH